MEIRKDKQTYPALYDPGFMPVDISNIESAFLPAGVSSPRRKLLANQLRLFIATLQSTGVRGELWIDGSFSTKNPEPMDIDVLLVIPRVVLLGMTEEGRNELAELTDPDNKQYVRAKWSCDLHVREASDLAGRRYYERLFSRNPDNENKKGIPVIQI